MINLNSFRGNFRSLWGSLWNECQPCFPQNGIRGISFSAPLGFNNTPALMAMPTKRKRRIDPQVIKLREERKKKKIDKEIRSLEKLKKTFKPIVEARMPPVLYTEMETRTRLVHVPQNVKEERILIEKEWSRYKSRWTEKEKKNIHAIVESQLEALNELKKESLELYNAAIQINPDLIPFTFNGPSDTPPLKGYSRPDGEYIDISKNWLEQWKPKN